MLDEVGTVFSAAFSRRKLFDIAIPLAEGLAEAHEAGVVHLSVTEPHIALPAVLERLRNRNARLASLTTRHASLDDVFVMLTGRQIEESDGATE